MKFTKPWALLEEDGVLTPVLDVSFQRTKGRRTRRLFVVDSGADTSVGPRKLCELLGLTWNAGIQTEIRGISQREECVVPARVHEVTVFVAEARKQILLPICFAEGDAPLLLGRDGFFDAFVVQFDKQRSLTTFEY